jgi:transposase
MECRRSYDSEFSDAEWSRSEPLVPAPKHGGRPAKHTRREILNGIGYAIRSGGAWKLRPHDLPAWRTVYHYFWSWRRRGVWEMQEPCRCGSGDCANGARCDSISCAKQKGRGGSNALLFPVVLGCRQTYNITRNGRETHALGENSDRESRSCDDGAT